ncbi:MAG: AbrB/MazE/SpoVT family DNA-binding domain-containing protein [Nitrososphaerales archaeon]
MVEEVKVTRNFQVTLPAEARGKLGVKVGDVLVADLQESKIVLEKKSADITKLRIRLRTKTDWKKVEATIREAGGDIAGRNR